MNLHFKIQSLGTLLGLLCQGNILKRGGWRGNGLPPLN